MKKMLLPLIVLTVMGNACSEDEPDLKSTLNFEVAHMLNGSSMVPGEFSYHSASDDTFNILTLQYFLSDIVLHKTDGSSVDIKDYFYVDGIDGSSTFSTSVPAGDYHKLSLYFGIPEAMNITNHFTDPPESGMEWPLIMGGGYHYMKMEGKYYEGASTGNFQLHTGPTSGEDYSIQFDFPLQLTMKGGSYTIRVGMDLEKWIESPNALSIKDMSMIMGNSAIQMKLQANGAHVLRLLSAS